MDRPWYEEAAEWLANDDCSSFDCVPWLHAAIEDRDRLKAEVERLKFDNDYVNRMATAQAVEIDRLRAALMRHGLHSRVCDVRLRFVRTGASEPLCTCGLDAALAGPGEAKP